MNGSVSPEAPSPVLLFAYNRPAHTLRCLQTLAAGALAGRTPVIAYVDGPRTPEGQATQAEVVAAIESQRSQFGSLVVHVRPDNVGLAANVIDGVTRTLQAHPSVIVLEDDLHCSPMLLDYFNTALRHFAGDARVGSIHAYCYPGMPAEPPFFFLPGGDCWGWATWRDRWALFQPDGRQLLRELIRRRRLRAFTLGFCAPYLRMLCRQILGRNNSWAVRWHASLFLQDRLTLYPAKGFVQNTGLDGSGTHCDVTDAYDAAISTLRVDAGSRFPEPAPSGAATRHFQRFFCSNRSLPGRMLYRCASFVLDMAWLSRALLK